MIAGLMILVAAFSFSVSPEEGFVSLTGNDPLSVFDRVKLGVDSVTFADGEIRFTGTPRGYLATKATYGDFALRFEWMFDVPPDADPVKVEANSGVLLRIKPPHKVWPVCLEYQITPDDPGRLFGLGGVFVGETDNDARLRAYRAPGRWNEAEVELIGERVVSRLNGEVISRGTFRGPSGPIGFQSEGGAVRFRKIRIKSISK
jgi:hypothetical protein